MIIFVYEKKATQLPSMGINTLFDLCTYKILSIRGKLLDLPSTLQARVTEFIEEVGDELCIIHRTGFEIDDDIQGELAGIILYLDDDLGYAIEGHDPWFGKYMREDTVIDTWTDKNDNIYASSSAFDIVSIKKDYGYKRIVRRKNGDLRAIYINGDETIVQHNNGNVKIAKWNEHFNPLEIPEDDTMRTYYPNGVLRSQEFLDGHAYYDERGRELEIWQSDHIICNIDDERHDWVVDDETLGMYEIYRQGNIYAKFTTVPMDLYEVLNDYDFDWDMPYTPRWTREPSGLVVYYKPDGTVDRVEET